MLGVFSKLNSDTPVETLDVLCFISQVAEKIERYDDCIKMVTAITSVKPDIPDCLKETIYHVFETVFKKNEDNIKSLKKTLESPNFRGATYDRRLGNLIHKIENEQIQLYKQYIKMLKADFLHVSADPADQYYVYKRIGDAFMYIGDIKSYENRESEMKEAAESYETALSVAEPFFGRLSSNYLSCALNYAAFMVKYQIRRDDATKLLLDAFSYGIMNTDKMLPEDRGRAIGILQLMRMNFSKIVPQQLTP